MSIRKKTSLAVVLILTISALTSGLYLSSLPQPEEQTLVLLTVGLDQNALPNEASSYEIQRASEHFSDVILGWSLEPSFRSEIPVEFTGVRQERQNLLFTLNDPDSSSSDALLSAVQERLDDYNEATNAKYVIALSRVSSITQSYAYWQFFLAINVGVLAICLLLLTLWHHAPSRRSGSTSTS